MAASPARRLQVSPSTIRKWIGEGLPRQVPDHVPVEVDPRSMVEIERVLAKVREKYPSREWAQALAAFLHDRDVLGQGWAAAGAAELERDKFVDRS